VRFNNIHPHRDRNASHTQRLEAAPQERDTPQDESYRRQEDQDAAQARRRNHQGTDAAKTTTDLKTTQAMLDRAAEKGYIHKNKAARLKSRLVKRIRAAAAAPPPAPKK